MDKIYKKEKPDLEIGDKIIFNLHLEHLEHTFNAYVESLQWDNIIIRRIVGERDKIKGDRIIVRNYKQQEYQILGKIWHLSATDSNKLVMNINLYLNVRDLGKLEEVLNGFPDLKQIEITDEEGNFIELIDV